MWSHHFMANRRGKWGNWQILFSWAPKSLRIVTAAMKLKVLATLKKSYNKPQQHIKKQRRPQIALSDEPWGTDWRRRGSVPDPKWEQEEPLLVRWWQWVPTREGALVWVTSLSSGVGRPQEHSEFQGPYTSPTEISSRVYTCGFLVFKRELWKWNVHKAVFFFFLTHLSA